MKHGLKWMVFCLLALVIVLLPAREAKALEIISAEHTDSIDAPFDETKSWHLRVHLFTYTIRDVELELCNNGNWSRVSPSCFISLEEWIDGENSTRDAFVRASISGYTPPTCTQNGSITVYASYTASYTASYDSNTTVNDTSSGSVDKLGHQIEQVSETPATCTANGTAAHYKCTRQNCGLLFTDAAGENGTTLEALKIGKLGHDWVVEDDPDEIDDGWHWDFFNGGDLDCARVPLRCQRNECDEKTTLIIASEPNITIEKRYNENTGKVETAYTATALYEGKTFSDTYTVESDPIAVDCIYYVAGVYFLNKPQTVDEVYNCHYQKSDWGGPAAATQVIEIGGEFYCAANIDTMIYEADAAKVSKVPATVTCTQPGTLDYWQCSSCLKMYSDEAAQNEIAAAPTSAALGHDWPDTWSLTEDGKSHTRACQRGCGESETFAHSGGTATCQAKAKCAVCEAEYGELAGHDWDTAWTTGNGKHWHRCKTQGCTEKNGEADHSGGTTTCQEKANCAACGEEYGEKNPNNHAGSIVDVKGYDATCTETGLTDGKQCEACKAFTVEQEEIEIDPDNHEGPIVTVKGYDATCTETGLTAGKQCTACKAFTVEQKTIEKDAKNHAGPIVDVKGKAATCTETGLTAGKQCTACKAFTVKQQVIPAKDHAKVTDAAVEPACTETGLTAGEHCSVCGAVLVRQETIPALGHKEVIDPAVEPTCTETGLNEGKHCSVCGAVLVKQETVKALGHKEVTDATVEPTCTETGLTEGKHCSVCGEVFTAQEMVPALGHAFGAWQSYVQGRHGRGCYRCGYEMTARCTLVTVSVGDESVVTLCPVCGYCEGMKGLTAVRGARAKGAVPDGILRVFVSEWDAAFRLLVVAFESDGRPVQPKGEVTVTLPAEIINGDSLALIGPKGEEIPVDYKTDGEQVTFTLNFMPEEGPVSALVLKLIPKT